MCVCGPEEGSRLNLHRRCVTAASCDSGRVMFASRISVKARSGLRRSCVMAMSRLRHIFAPQPGHVCAIGCFIQCKIVP